MRLAFFLLLVLWLTQPLQARDLYRIVYSDDPIRSHLVSKDDKKFGPERDTFIEEAYGSLYYVLPSVGEPPAQPDRVDGYVVHSDALSDSDWVLGETQADNPSANFMKVAEELGEKWAEYQFLSKSAPEMAPPEMRLGTDFVQPLLTKAMRKQRRELESLSPAEEKKLLANLSEKVNKISPETLEVVRKKINEQMGGKSILKVRAGFHSEGRLPKTHKDWGEIWKGYLAETRPEIERIRKEIENTSTPLQNEIFNLPYVEGTVLEALLLDPESVIIQRMMEIEKEVRIHVVEHEVLTGATFLRMYPLGQYLTQDEIEKVEETFKSKFLDNLTGKYRPFSSSSDVAIEKGTGKMRILDLNPGYDSGYFFPEEDLFTTHRLALRFTGKNSQFLDLFENLVASPLEKKQSLLRKIKKDYQVFVYGDRDGYDHESFWDRIIRHYIDDVLHEEPTSEVFDLILGHFAAAKLKSVSVYFQFINEVQERLGILLSQNRAKEWVKFLNRLNQREGEEYKASLTNGKIIVVANPDRKN